MLRLRKVRSWTAILVGVAICASVGLAISPAEKALASISGFKAGNIISDAVFYNGNAQTAAQVQTFLEARLPRCTIGDPGRTAGMAWPANNSSIADACLKDYHTATTSRVADRYCGAYTGASRESAAQIISKVAKVCGISPNVLLVLLEKEQSLVTDSWPTVRQFDVAMGANCPDSGANWSASCDPKYYGFAQQVYRAAWLLKYYKLNPNEYRYRALQTNTIQWHPNPACGTSQVYIENQATAALYIYTPYRPNQAALDAGWGIGDSCSAYGNRNFYNLFTSWFGSTQGSQANLDPVGKIETESKGPKQVTLSGYAFDPETTAPIDIHYYLGGPYGIGRWGGAQTALAYSSTVANSYPSFGGNHGFSILITGLAAPTEVCVYAINVGQGGSTLLECRTVSPASGLPLGNYEALTVANGVATASGWVLDPDDAGSVEIHAYLNGEYPAGTGLGSFRSGSARADVARVYPLYGSQNGFSFQYQVPVGTSKLCLYAIDREGLGNTFMGCRSVSTASGPPIGNLEGAVATPGGMTLSGWALDPDTSDSIGIHIYVDGRWGGALVADQNRADVGRAYPGYGDAHGFTAELRGFSAGLHTACVYGIDVGGTVNSLIGCRNVNVPSGDPIGSFDGISHAADGTKLAGGWTIDPDTTEPLQVHAYLNGRWYGAFAASSPRPDVGAAYPAAGPNHGYSFPVVGTGQLCIYAINVGSGTTNPLIGCRSI